MKTQVKRSLCIALLLIAGYSMTMSAQPEMYDSGSGITLSPDILQQPSSRSPLTGIPVLSEKSLLSSRTGLKARRSTILYGMNDFPSSHTRYNGTLYEIGAPLSAVAGGKTLRRGLNPPVIGDDDDPENPDIPPVDTGLGHEWCLFLFATALLVVRRRTKNQRL